MNNYCIPVWTHRRKQHHWPRAFLPHRVQLPANVYLMQTEQNCLGRSGHKVILVREETKPEDIHGFFASQGILTSRGGKTSHAAVVARGMGKPCVAGAEGIHVDVKLRQATIGEKILFEGDYITIDGGTGYVYQGVIPTFEPSFSDELKTVLQWADETAKLKVMANADTPDAAAKSIKIWCNGHWALPHGKNVQCKGPSANCS